MATSPTSLIRKTCSWVVANAAHVSVVSQPLLELANEISDDVRTRHASLILDDDDGILHGLHMDWGTSKEVHLQEENESEEESDECEWTALYVLVLSSLNFCFWPIENFEYRTLATNLKNVFREFRDRKDECPLHPSNLCDLSEDVFRRIVFSDISDVALLSERLRLLKEVGIGLLRSFDGRVSNLIRSAHRSVDALVSLVTSHFPGFRDHVVYSGRQVFLYKRAQIFCGDLYGIFHGKSLGCFDDISKLTMFPDYRVPQLFNDREILVYDAQLSEIVMSRQLLPSGCLMEVEIRAASVVVVERLVQLLAQRKVVCRSQEVDWWLWEKAEKEKDTMKPCHRTLTICY